MSQPAEELASAVAETTASDVFAQLQANVPQLARRTPAQRAERIRALVAATMAARERIQAVVHEELKLCATDVDQQLLMIKAEGEFIASRLARWMKPEPVNASLMSLGKKSYVRYEPKGVVLNIATWNAPYAIGLVPAFGAIAAGNAIALKPSELAPRSAALIQEIVAEVCPADEFAVIQGGAEVAQALLAQPFNHIFYIGGHAVGRLIMKAAADHFASVTLEMGGKNPVIVDASANIQDAARKISWGRLSNGGQICIAPDYALVHESVFDEFTDELGRCMARQYNADGQGFDRSPYFAHLINERHFRRVKGLIDDATEHGARIRFGGGSDEASCFIEPTILDNVNDEMAIMHEEIFGPVITVTPFASKQEVPSIISRRPKPLSSYIFAKDRAAIDYFLDSTTSGSTVINNNIVQSGTNPQLPFGGVNASGIGRIGGRYTFLETSNARAVVEEGPAVIDPELMFPPYTDKYRKMIGDMLSRSIQVPDGVINFINRLIRLRRYK